MITRQVLSQMITRQVLSQFINRQEVINRQTIINRRTIINRQTIINRTSHNPADGDNWVARGYEARDVMKPETL